MELYDLIQEFEISLYFSTVLLKYLTVIIGLFTVTPSGLGGRYRHFIGHIRKLLGIFENNLGLCGEFPLVSMSTTPPSDVSYDFKYILSFYDIIMV